MMRAKCFTKRVFHAFGISVLLFASAAIVLACNSVYVTHLFFVLSVASCFFIIVSTFVAVRFVRETGVVCDTRYQPVSLLKPLHGLDFDLADNLRSFCRQSYPDYQVIFGIQHYDDPALAVAWSVKSEFPDLDIRIVVDEAQPFGNSKVSNLQNMIGQATRPWLVIADSDMRVRSDYLRIVTAPLADESVGAVTCAYRGIAADRGVWSALGAMHVNFGFLPQALLGHRLNIGGGCFGATVAIRQATLERVDGFRSIGDKLADDHALGQAVRACGLRVELAPCLVDTIVYEPTYQQLIEHELRWARTVFLVQPWGHIGSFLTHPLPLALLAVIDLPAVLGAGILSSVIVLRWLAVCVQAWAFGLKSPRPLTLIVRDVLSFYVFVSSFFPHLLTWRNAKFAPQRNGIIVHKEKTARP